MKRLLKQGPMTNKSYFRVIFALFLAAQVISLALNMAVSTFLRNWLAEDAKSYNRSVIQSIETTMNSMLTEITRLVQSTAVVADNADSLNQYGNFTIDNYLLVKQIALDFASVMSIKESIGSWFYYYPDKDLVIADGNIYHADLYFSKYYVYDRLGREEINSLVNTPTRLLLDLDTQKEWTLSGKSIDRDVVPFVFSYKNLTRQEALLVVNIQTNYIYDQTLHYKSSDQMGLLIADGDGNPIVSWGTLQKDSVTAEVLPEVEEGDFLLSERKLDGAPMVFLSSGSVFPNWKIHIAYGKGEFYKKSNLLFWSLTVFNLVVTLFGVGVSYLFSRRIFSPIYNLTRLLYPNTPKSGVRRDEIHMISARMQEIQQNNQVLQENLRTMLPSVKQYHLRELLTRSDYLADGDNRVFLAQRVLLPPDDAFLLCRVLVRYREEFLATLPPEQQELQKNDVLDVIHTLMQNLCARTELIELSPHETFFLLSLAGMPQRKKADFRQCAAGLLEEVVKLFSYDRENIRVHFVLSGFIDNADGITAACTGLTGIGARMIPLEADSGSFLFPESQPLPPSPSWDERTEKLENLLLAGDREGLSRLFQELLGDPAQVSMERAASLYFWLLERAGGCLEQYRLDAAVLEPNRAYDPLLAFSMEELRDASLALLDAAAMALSKQRPDKRDSFTAFIKERYADCGLSTESAAEYFQCLPSAFSKSFKDEFGISFPKYLAQYRIHRSKELLLSTSMTVDEIASAVGISNRVTFNRVFNQLEGMPPGKYRTLYRPLAAEGEKASGAEK